ncbi:hypothetical protein CB0940_10225 [Cercospora beticola]|uniref:CDAN1-interacting nuclease 1 n=1 Tax=Cercospora beticola TaxID=122368 RepID=A0A2G5HVM9_CERBT|nr:hypothetical protein CB0940_10225 [Cercospora beticola]PIA96302.1 hypothetical protein CB0940_10225 [Cercospora beticola]WPB06934.1 hypothetical protein RHO25_011594 [Cercospora beticola]
MDALPYSGIPAHKIKIIFQAACARRHRNPQIEDIIRTTGTDVDREVVSAILEGALRLLPPDRSEEGDSLRREKEAIRAAHANAAEHSFVQAIKECYQGGMRDESQQKKDIRQAIDNGVENIINLTPDIMFDTPAEFNGKQICWMEFKNTFGFRKNPFIHRKHIKQVKRYRDALGPGVIVYRLGYEQNLFQIEGVGCYRETDVLSAIGKGVSA